MRRAIRFLLVTTFALGGASSAKPTSIHHPAKAENKIVVTVTPRTDEERKLEAEREERKEKVDADMRDYTQQLADYTKYLYRVTLAVAILGGFQFFVLLYQGIQLKRTVDSAKDDFTAEHRPWIPDDIAIGEDLSWTADGDAVITLIFNLRNLGRSPALNVSPSYKVMNGVGSYFNPWERQREFAEELRSRPISLRDNGPTIFPGQPPFQQMISAHLSKAEIDRENPGIPDETGVVRPVVDPIIFGCITYELPWGSERRQTGFVLDLKKIDRTGHRPRLRSVSFREEVPANCLQLDPSHWGRAATT